MHITSITVRNYRVHRELKVELNRNLTLIGGPNETGKSTLVEAAHRALFLRAKITGETQKSMVSNCHPGHPEVEVSFDSGGQAYVISKRFSGTNGTATLTEVNGPTWQGDEADTKLAEILGVEAMGGGRGAGDRVAVQWAHLWVWQGQAGTDPSEHANNQRVSLLTRLQNSGGAAAMQSDLDARVARAIAEQHDKLFNKNGTPKRESDLGRAIQDTDAATLALEQAQESFQKLQQAIADFQDARCAITTSQNVLEMLQPEKAKLAIRLDRVTQLRGDEQTQKLILDTAIASHEALARGHDQILGLRTEIQIRTATLEPKNAAIDRLDADESACKAALKQTDESYQKALDEVRARRLRHELAMAYGTRFEKVAERDKLLGKLQQVNEEKGRLSEIEAQLAKLPEISPAKLKALQKLEAKCSNEEAALHAMAAGIEVVTSDLAIQVGGKAIQAGQSEILTEDTEITIGSKTRLRIKPGGGTSLVDARKLLQNSRKSLQAGLDELGITSIAEASEASTRRQQWEAEAKTRQAVLTSLGADAVDQELANAENSLTAAEAEVQRRTASVKDLTPPATVADTQSMVAQTQVQLSEVEAVESSSKSAHDAAARALKKSSEAHVAHRQTVQEEQQTLNAVITKLRVLVDMQGEDAERDQKLAAQLTARTDAENLLTSTQKTLAELQPEFLSSDSERLQRAFDQATTANHEAETKLAVARNTLQSDGATDPQAVLAQAEAHSRSAEEQRMSALRKASAIQLIHQRFLEEQSALADQFTLPLADKISSYLRCIFGAEAKAALKLEDNVFVGVELIRPGQNLGALPFASLSVGTKEQVASAVRLAMAEVLAEGHDRCLPLVFDDAFTYSDPDRVAALQRMLDFAASQGLQIIILSCNPSDYATLGARTIALRAQAASLKTPSEQPATFDSTDSPPYSEEEFAAAVEVTDELRQALLSALRSAGGSKGNGALRQDLGWSAPTYDAVKNDIVASGEVIPGRGRGGSIALGTSEPSSADRID